MPSLFSPQDAIPLPGLITVSLYIHFKVTYGNTRVAAWLAELSGPFFARPPQGLQVRVLWTTGYLSPSVCAASGGLTTTVVGGKEEGCRKHSKLSRSNTIKCVNSHQSYNVRSLLPSLSYAGLFLFSI